MENIRKILCIDDSKSHRNGLLPYIEFNSNTTYHVDVVPGNENGNYGNFVCDFTFISGWTEYDEEYETDIIHEKEVARLKYLDEVRKYNLTQESIRNGIRLRRLLNSAETIVSVECINAYDGDIELIGYSAQTSGHVETGIKWTTNLCENREKYDFAAADANLFYMDNEGFYHFNENSELCEDILRRIESGEYVSVEEYKFLNKIEHHKRIIYENFIILIYDYDNVLKYETEWNDFWNDGWQMVTSTTETQFDSWQKEYFYSGHTPFSHFKFCQEFEKYMLGKIIVPEFYMGSAITGSIVPKYVSLTNFMNYYNWFNENYQHHIYDSDIADEWERRGGDLFYSFLSSIVPTWVYDRKHFINCVFFAYSTPYIEFPEIFITSENNENLIMSPYEYSVDSDGNLVNITKECTEEYLVPRYADLSGSNIVVESKLSSLISPKASNFSGMFGIIGEFNSSGNSRGYECNCYSGWSSSPEIVRYYSGYVSSYTEYLGESVMINDKISKTKLESNDDVKPKVVGNNVYQIVDIEAINSQTLDFQNQEFVTTTGDDGSVSAFTYWSCVTQTLYKWWECTYNSNITNYYCADGEFVESNDRTKYRNVPTLSSAPQIFENVNAGSKYFVMARYDNGNTNIPHNVPIDTECTIKKLSIPFEVGVPVNIRSCDGFEDDLFYDMVTSVDSGENIITINYVIGASSAVSINNSGVHYTDSYMYNGISKKKMPIDGAFFSEIYYEDIDYSSSEKDVYDEYTGRHRKAILSTITGMEVSTQWSSATSISTILFSKNSVEGLSDEPIYIMNLTIDRGNASAWESHFKLGECNTLEDLENNGNGYFNVQ